MQMLSSPRNKLFWEKLGVWKYSPVLCFKNGSHLELYIALTISCFSHVPKRFQEKPNSVRYCDHLRTTHVRYIDNQNACFLSVKQLNPRICFFLCTDEKCKVIKARTHRLGERYFIMYFKEKDLTVLWLVINYVWLWAIKGFDKVNMLYFSTK